ncbi:hypothetical protein KSD_45530 [Ktedonobacter sp. SOSP1-85]|nr:hypothetical protein KSD_45530 [Ktedonobacter sp. SOSP1-85]
MAPIETVSYNSPNRGEEKVRQCRYEGDQAKQQGRIGELKHLPTLTNRLNPKTSI